MSNYHILTADEYGNRFNVVFHVLVPNADNDVGVNFRTAIVEWQGGASAITSRLPGIGTELTQLQAGELYEVSRTFNSNPNETLAQKRARLDVYFAEAKVNEQARLSAILSYWGYQRDVP